MTSASQNTPDSVPHPPVPCADGLLRSESAESPALAADIGVASGPASSAPPVTASSGSGSSRPSDATYVSPSSARGPALAAPVVALPGVGQRLDHFEILELIGGGGMGLVYRARDTALDRIVAIKILSSNRTADEETVRRFRNEA